MSISEAVLSGVSAVAIGRRALMIEGPPGSGKSSLALALIDRGALLIGDDAVTLAPGDGWVMVSPPPNIAGLLEVRGVGLVELPLAPAARLALILTLGEQGERLPEKVPQRSTHGCKVPQMPFDPGMIAPAVRAEWALRTFGLEPI